MEDPGLVLRQMAMAMRLSRALYVAAELGIADHLANGPMSSAALAAVTSTHAGALRRLMRALSAARVFAEASPDSFSLTELGDHLRVGHPRSMRAGTMFLAGPMRWEMWSNLLRCVRSGAPAIDRQPGQTIFNTYADRPAEFAIANEAMRAFTGLASRAILGAIDFSRFQTLMDVGGGTGEMIGGILAVTPGLRGTLVDLPDVVAGASAVLDRHGVTDRCILAPADFFTGVPAGADAIMLKQVVHDWDDSDAVALLTRCEQAMPAAGVLLIVERVMPEMAENGASMEPFLLDLEMLVGPGGRERTEAEYRALLAASGLTLTGVTPTASAVSVIEARRSGSISRR